MVFALYFASLTIVNGALTIFSNIVTVNVREYDLSMVADNTNPLINTNIMFQGSLTLNGAVVPNKIVKLYESNDNINWNAILTNITDSSGFFTFTYNVTQKGTWHYKAGFDTQ